jgi:hypothetical protein
LSRFREQQHQSVSSKRVAQGRWSLSGQAGYGGMGSGWTDRIRWFASVANPKLS